MQLRLHAGLEYAEEVIFVVEGGSQTRFSGVVLGVHGRCGGVPPLDGIIETGHTDGIVRQWNRRVVDEGPVQELQGLVIGEEAGLVGVSIVLLLYGLLIYQGVKIALKAPDRFGTYLAFGLTLAVGLQAFINSAVVMGLLPTKGLPLPLISYGGSSLLTNLTAMGILMNISSYAREQSQGWHRGNWLNPQTSGRGSKRSA